MPNDFRRIVPLKLAHKFRELGGYATTADRTVRRVRVYRSALAEPAERVC